MKTVIFNYLCYMAFAAVLSVGSVVALAEDASGAKDQQTIGAQVQNILQSGKPEQAATIQMGLSPEQLNSLMGSNNQEQQQQQKKFVYKPKDPTEVEKPQRLFYNIPKWH